MECRYCNYDLDDGDVFKVLSNLDEYKNFSKEEMIIEAGNYGWTLNNQKHFSKIQIIQFHDKPQIEICPNCSGIWPSQNSIGMLKEFYQEKINIEKLNTNQCKSKILLLLFFFSFNQ